MSVLTALSDWPLEPPLGAILAAAALYPLGLRRRVSGPEPRLRIASFYGGLLVLVLAFDSPLAAFDDTLFWAHMAQHVLLLTAAPPLLLYGRPWNALWRPVPLALRRPVARALVTGSWAAPLRAAGRFLASPVPAWLLFNGVLVGWHLPVLYDATLRLGLLHDLEHVLFLSTGLVFWAQIVDSPPFHGALDGPRRAGAAALSVVVGWVLAIVLAFAPEPLYHGYAALASRPGGISALADQHLAAGVMWVPGSIAYVIAIVVCVYRWLGPEPARARRPPRFV